VSINMFKYIYLGPRLYITKSGMDREEKGRTSAKREIMGVVTQY